MLPHPLSSWTKGPPFPKGQKWSLLCVAHFLKCPVLGAHELISVLGTACCSRQALVRRFASARLKATGFAFEHLMQLSSRSLTNENRMGKGERAISENQKT